MNQTENIDSRLLFWILGFIAPMMLVAYQIIFSLGSTPLMVLALTWFGIALLFYLGVYEERD